MHTVIAAVVVSVVVADVVDVADVVGLVVSLEVVAVSQCRLNANASSLGLHFRVSLLVETHT